MEQFPKAEHHKAAEGSRRSSESMRIAMLLLGLGSTPAPTRQNSLSPAAVRHTGQHMAEQPSVAVQLPPVRTLFAVVSDGQFPGKIRPESERLSLLRLFPKVKSFSLPRPLRKGASTDRHTHLCKDSTFYTLEYIRITCLGTTLCDSSTRFLALHAIFQVCQECITDFARNGKL